MAFENPCLDVLDTSNSITHYHAPATVTHLSGTRMIHVSGQSGMARDGTVPDDCESQIQLALFNLRKIMLLSGTSVEHIAKLTVYIVNYNAEDPKHIRPIQRFLCGHRPAMTVVPVTQLAHPSWLFTVEAVLVSPPPSGWISSRMLGTGRGDTYDVLVIGGGLAGLSAAHQVLQAGLSCVVLEARDRVGGKTWSKPLPGGGVAELGAAWINDVNQTRMFEIASQLGLELIEQNTDGKCVLQDVDDSVSSFCYGEIPQFDEAVMKDVARIRDTTEDECQQVDTWQPRSTRFDTMTFESYLHSKNASRTALLTASIWTRAMLGVEPRDMSALFFLNYCKSGGGLLTMRSDQKGGGQHLRFRKGTQGVALGLTDRLPPGTVRLDTVVERISHNHADYIEVTTKAGNVLHAKKVITSVPSPALKLIRFQPDLPHAKRAFFESTGYGYYTKVMVVFRRPFWVERGFCGLAQSFTGPAAVVRDTSSPADNKHVLTCFMGGVPGYEWSKLPSAAAKQEKLLQQLGKLYGLEKTINDEFLELHTYDWSDDAWSGYGCPCASLPAGVLDTIGPDALRVPVGSIHFAGTETAGEWKGYMEGAVRSGERAAQEVIKSLRSPLLPHL